MENTVAFKELKKIQIVLLSAMIRVDSKYTLYQFENDMKSVLTKCVQNSKKTEDKKTADENNEKPNDSEDINNDKIVQTTDLENDFNCADSDVL